VAPRAVHRWQPLADDVLPGQVGGAAGGAKWQLRQLLDLAIVDAEEVPCQLAPVAAGGGMQCRHRTVRGKAKADRVGNALAGDGGGGTDGGGDRKVKVRRVLDLLQEGRSHLLMGQEEEGRIRVLMSGSRSRRVGEREKKWCAAVAAGDQKIIVVAAAAIDAGHGAAAVVMSSCKKPCALLS
jgi:hypothetical protein